jgi:hypothetical protein
MYRNNARDESYVWNGFSDTAWIGDGDRRAVWISGCRRLNTTFEQTKEHFIAFIKVAIISLLSRRLPRLVTRISAPDTSRQIL